MRRILLVAFLILASLNTPVIAARPTDELIEDAVLILKEFADQPDSEYFRNMLKRAHGVAIFPRVIKAGLGLGGRYGKGILLQFNQDSQTWFGPYFANLKGVSYGFQVGVQSTALVLVITSERGMESLKEEKITLGGNISIATGPIGRSAEAGTDLGLKAPIYSYSMSKGAFAGASFEGAVISNDVNANLVYWQEKLSPQEALSKAASGESVQPLIKKLDDLKN